jgi:hypothetical protein
MNIYGLQTGGARCSATLGSVTAAMKAKRTLARGGIVCEVVKISARSRDRGCVYGIEYPCELTGSVRLMLTHAGIELL